MSDMAPKELAHAVARLRDQIMLAIYPEPDFLLVLKPGTELPPHAAELIGVRVQHVHGLEAPCLGVVESERTTGGPADLERFGLALVKGVDWSQAMPELADRLEYLVPPGIFDGLTAVYAHPVRSWTSPGIFVGFRIEAQSVLEGGSAA